MEFRCSGTRPVQLILAGDFWYNSRPVFKAEPAARIVLFGNKGASDSPDQPPLTWPPSPPPLTISGAWASWIIAWPKEQRSERPKTLKC